MLTILLIYWFIFPQIIIILILTSECNFRAMFQRENSVIALNLWSFYHKYLPSQYCQHTHTHKKTTDKNLTIIAS